MSPVSHRTPEREGVIKFDCRLTAAPALPASRLATLNGWRSLLFRLGLIGQDPARYGGVGFGNVSERLAAGEARFVISGTQTGAIGALAPEHYVVVTACDVRANRVIAEGPIRPSSEAMTHAVLYAADPAIAFVYHVHSPEIWRNAARLALPATHPDAAYGTPEMADEVTRLAREAPARERGVLVMTGHEDGILSFGASADAAGQCLLAAFAAALALPLSR